MPGLTQPQKDQLQILARLPDDQIDLSEAPEIHDWSTAVRGKFYKAGRAHVGRVQAPTDTSE